MLTLSLFATCAHANPSGGTVTQGSATIGSRGPQLTIKQNSGFAQINWQSFNIGAGETTTFLQPSSTSVLFNQINGLNPSRILGNLNANGLIILQNGAGFYVGGQASIAAHGLILTTAPMAPPDVTGGGAWQFNTPPPTAKIINYGTLNIGGGPAYLIANDIENNGTISNPGGKIGLYAGKQVLISSSPDGRGLSAEVTLPQGSVDNTGRLIADGGSIAMRAQVVNQGGLVQANSVRENNGTIELYASDSLNLSSQSVISAQGGSRGVSAGGNVTLKSDNAYSDEAGSVINVSGGAHGGNGGHVEISAKDLPAIHSSIVGHAAPGYTSGSLFIDPDNILLTDYGDTIPDNGTVNASDPNSSGSPDTLTLDINQINNLIQNNNLSQISLAANYNIEVATFWNLPDSSVANSLLSLTAGRNITIDDQCAIQAGRNWSIKMTAGTELTSAANRQSGMDGIYVMGSGIIQTLNGNINLTAGNEVMVDNGANGYFVDGNGVTTTGGGSINVTATYGDVNTGGSPEGYMFSQRNAPYYRVSPQLGGISTMKGGDVTITAGGNVTSYFPLNHDDSEAGAGAYGSQHGNVTITAGGSVYGHYVLANGMGTITAENGDVGSALTSQGFALSLISGNWTVNAPKGNIYLQEIRNPNGVFNNHGNAASYAGFHLFDYSADASLSLNAANLVEITGLGAPRSGDPVPLIFPPSFEATTGAGGFVLDTSVILFPSAIGNLSITTTGGGNLVGTPDFTGLYPTLSMSESSSKQWTSAESFGTSDRASTPLHLADANPVTISVSGSMDTINLVTTKATQITVGGDMINSSFVGENLNKSDVTSIKVGGQIFNQPYYSFVTLKQPIVPVDPFNPYWYSIFGLLVNPALIDSTPVPSGSTATDLKNLASLMALFQVSPGSSPNPGFVYNPTTLQLGFGGQMSSTTLTAMTGPLEAIQLGPDRLPVVVNGHFATYKVSFVPAAAIEQLYTDSQVVPKTPLKGLQIAGPGEFDINAGSMNLGSSAGVESWGYGGTFGNLLKYTPAGAAINVDLAGNLDMVTSRIASFEGGSVSVVSGGEMDLGSSTLLGTSAVAFGIYSSGPGDVSVIAAKNININGSRIGSYDGGNVFIESLLGDVQVGSGGNTYVYVPVVSKVGGQPSYNQVPVYGSGVVAVSLPGSPAIPGNVTINTPQGSIISDSAGILQLALGTSISSAPTVTLNAGTAADGNNPGFLGNIDLGNNGSGLISINSVLKATGSIAGLVYSKYHASLTAVQNINVNLLSRTGDVNSTTGKIIGILAVQDLSLSGSTGPEIVVMSQSASVNGAQATSTIGTSAPALASSQSAVQQASAQAKQETTLDTSGSSLGDQSKKKKTSVLQRIKRVTVLLSGNE